MAISVETLHRRMQDLTRKDKAGYLTNDEFNRHLAVCQRVLLDYFWDKFEDSQVIPQALRMFVKKTNIALNASNEAVLPADFEHHIRCFVRVSTNVHGGNPLIAKVLALPINASEINLSLTSPIRKPNISKGHTYYRIIDGKIEIHAGDATPGSIEFEYLRTPAEAIRAVTLDGTNDQENYDANNSVDLEWESYEQPKFEDLLLYYYGLPTGESKIIQWLQAKQPITRQNS